MQLEGTQTNIHMLCSKPASTHMASPHGIKQIAGSNTLQQYDVCAMGARPQIIATDTEGV